MKVAVVVPTYNEKKNIVNLIKSLKVLVKGVHVFVVDDNSPDGTGRTVDALAKKDRHVHLVHRKKKEGIGPAYKEGFTRALLIKPDIIIQMDADFSHDPKALPRMLKEIARYDVVVGSRYLGGVSVVNWPIRRLILSYSANLFARTVTGLPIHDATGGFKCFRRKVLEAIDFSRVRANGYFFQIEMNYFSYRLGFRIKEIPIIFTDRHAGTSKMSRSIFFEAIFRLLLLRFRKIKRSSGRFRPA
ncbi:polyprenol monophosphomannose synthase [Spirochaetota bacterium]